MSWYCKRKPHQTPPINFNLLWSNRIPCICNRIYTFLRNNPYWLIIITSLNQIQLALNLYQVIWPCRWPKSFSILCNTCELCINRAPCIIYCSGFIYVKKNSIRMPSIHPKMNWFTIPYVELYKPLCSNFLQLHEQLWGILICQKLSPFNIFSLTQATHKDPALETEPNSLE